MNCKDAEKHIHLYKADELSNNETTELKQHIARCSNCTEVLSEMEGYKNLISKLEEILPASINKAEFTNNIMSSIQGDTSIPFQPKSTFRFTQSIIFRVASIVLILVSISFFFVQNRNINQLTASLQVKYENKEAKSEFLDNYNECVDISQNQIAQLVENDMELLAIFENSARGIFPKDIERYAAKICQQPVDITSMDAKAKKQLLFRLIKEGQKL